MVDAIILLQIALILIVAKIFGEIAERIKISALVGEVFAGIILGPLLLLVTPSVFLEQLASFGILLLLFLIGLTTKFEDVKKDVYVASYLGISAALFSFVLGFLAGWIIFGSIEVAIFLGVAIISTSTAITLRSLHDVGEFHTKIYQMALAIDVADEVIAILALSVLTSFFALGAVRIWEVAALFFVVLGFIIVIMNVGARVAGRALSAFEKMRDEQVLVAIPLVIIFLIAFLSENVGIAGVTGAFLAGMMLSRSPLTETVIMPKMKTIGYGFFIPLFFAYSAVLLDLGALAQYWWLILLLVAVGAFGKIIGIALPASRYGVHGRDRNMLAASMIPRGEYSIVIAQLALTAAVIQASLYTVIIAFVIITILITPIILRLVKGR